MSNKARLYNGNATTVENVLAMLKESEEDTGDMSDKEIAVIKKVASQEYEGAEEDLKYLTEKLQEKTSVGYTYIDANWQTAYDILSEGEWYYQR